MVTPLRVSMLGDLVVSRPDGTEVGGWVRPSAAKVLCLVLLSQGRAVDRAAAAAALFPALAPERAMNALSKAAHGARAALGSEAGAALTTQHGRLSWDAAAELDADEALVLARTASPLTSADLASRVADDERQLLPAWDDEWLGAFRAEIDAGRRAARTRLADDLHTVDPAGAARTWERLVEGDPLDRDAQLGWLRSLLSAGDYAGARSAYLSVRRTVWIELGADPDPAVETVWRAAADQLHRPTDTVVELQDPVLPILDGRDAELATVEMRLLAAEHGHGGFAVVAGPDGAGKSELLRTVADRCRRRGWRVAESAAGRAAGSYETLTGPLDELLAGTPGQTIVRELGAGRPERALPPRRPGQTEESIQIRLAHALDHAATIPTLLVVDDVDLADAASQRLVRALTGLPPSRQWSLLVSARTSGSFPADQVTTLGPLAPDVMERLVRSSCPHLAPDEVAEAVARAQGNALFALEIARATAAGIRPAPVPPSAIDLVRRRLDALPAGHRWILPLIVLAGEDATWPLLTVVASAMPDRDASALPEAVASLVSEGLVADEGSLLAPAHPVIGDAAVALLSRSQRASAHDLLAGSLTGAGAPHEAQARHRIAAFDFLPTPGRATTAATAATRAAHRALEQADDQGAADLARCALRAFACCAAGDRTGLAGDRLNAHMVLGHALAISAPREALAAYENGIASAGNDDDRGRLMIAMGWLHYTHGEHSRSAQCYQRAMGLPRISSVLGAEARTDLGWILARQGLFDRSLALYEVALELLGDADEPAVRALLMDRQAMTMAFAGQLEQAAQVADGAYEEATRTSRRELLAAVQTHRGNIAGRRGDWESALRFIDDSLELARACGDVYVESVAWWTRTDVLTRQGDRAGALEANDAEQAALRLAGNPAHLAACLRRRQRLLDDASLTSSVLGVTQ